MSIISEALKKAQEERLKAPGVEHIRKPESVVPALSPGMQEVTITENNKVSNPLLVIPLVIVIGAAALALLMFFYKPSPITAATTKGTKAGNTPAAAHVKPKVDAPDSSPVSIPAAQGTAGTPAQNIPQTSLGAPLPVLSGIMNSKADPKAVLNGELCGVGHIVNGYTIKRIYNDKVVLDSPDGEKTLKIQ